MDESLNKNKKRLLATLVGVALSAIAAFSYLVFFQTAQTGTEKERFIVPLNSDKPIVETLKSAGFIKNTFAFKLASIFNGGTEPGGYQISKSQNVWSIASTLSKNPYMKWVVIPEGLRKEEIAELLAKNLGWPEEEKDKWIKIYTAPDSDHTEGVYFPDTYLISVNEAPIDVAKRLRVKFEEKFSPFAKEAVAQNIKWTTLLKLASIVQREAGGKEDMPLVAGILWNRLSKNMMLEVDATLQYARGDTGNGWWAPIKVSEKQIDSPYNTYKYTGLPPHPISNPGLEAIEAALRPATTTCLYYLHDSSGGMHCSDTYEGHKQNIEKYL